MTTPEKCSSANMVCIALAIALYSLTISPQDARAAEPSAAEILAASKAAMSQPLKYRHIMGNAEMVVYQKTLPDGSLALLMDMLSPIKKTNIMYGDKSYELYLDHRVAIDTQFMYQAARDKAASTASLLGDKAAESFKLIGSIQHDGKECYELESTLTPDMVAALAKTVPPEAKDMMPAKYRYVIEKNTHLMLEREVLAHDGSTLSKVEFKDIKPQLGLSDELFLLPPGFEVKKPTSMREYTSLVTNMLNPDTSIIALKKQLDELKRRRPPLRTPPESPSRADLEKQVETYAKSRMPQVDKRAETLQPKSVSTTRTILLVFSLALFALCALFALYRLKNTRKKTN